MEVGVSPRPAGFDARQPPRKPNNCSTSRRRRSTGSSWETPLQLEQTRLRREEGYITVCSRDDDGRSWRLQEVHCSVQRIAEEFPAVCDQEPVDSSHRAGLPGGTGALAPRGGPPAVSGSHRLKRADGHRPSRRLNASMPPCCPSGITCGCWPTAWTASAMDSSGGCAPRRKPRTSGAQWSRRNQLPAPASSTCRSCNWR